MILQQGEKSFFFEKAQNNDLFISPKRKKRCSGNGLKIIYSIQP